MVKKECNKILYATKFRLMQGGERELGQKGGQLDLIYVLFL